MTTTISSDSIDNSVRLALHDITKKFGNTVALDGVSLSTQPGRITALLGENGAGKTTLMRIAFGMIQPDAGSITVNGIRQRLMSPANAIAAGVGMVHQQFSLIPAMTVAENIALGGRGKYSFASTAVQLKDIGDRTGLVLDPAAHVADLGSAERQKLEIVRTLAHSAKVLILDEPTAVLTPKDRVELFTQLRKFADDGGAVILITHKLADALEHADDVIVLRRARVVLNAVMSEVNEQSLVTAMLGSAPAQMRTSPQNEIAAPTVASLDHASILFQRTGNPVDVSVEIKGGEILGIAALDGAGTPLMRVLSGRTKLVSGRVQLPVRVGFVPENRREEALIGEFSLTENLALAGAGARKGVVDWEAIAKDAARIVEDFDVRTSGVDASPEKLSGGNQQRFVLGRELQKNPELLVLENPTQGLDVNAAAFIHDQMRAARDGGAAVVFYSSDLDELAQLSDTVLVISVEGLIRVTPDRGEIGRALLGAARK